MSQPLPRRADWRTSSGQVVDPRDLHLLRSLSGAGMLLRSSELAGDADLEMTQAEVDERLARLVAAGLVKCYFIATPAGSAKARLADLSGQQA